MGRSERSEKAKSQVFDSREARDRWQLATYGHVRNGFREPDALPDDRPIVLRGMEGIDEDIWVEAARRVMALPDFGELPFEQRLGLIAAAAGRELDFVVRRRHTPVRSMPTVKPMAEAAYNRRMEMLRNQALGIQREPGCDDT